MPTRDPHVSRRDFLAGAAAVGVASLRGLSHRASAAPTTTRGSRPPNVLLIMSDEHNPHVTGCYGSKVVRTPHMDELAATGVTFDTHYCNSPICVPSRASLTAGKYCSRVDTWGLTTELPSADIASLPRVMNAAGYESFLCGKQHYDYDRRYGFTEVGGNFNNSFKTGKGTRESPLAVHQDGPIAERFTRQFHPGHRGASVVHDRRVTAGAVDFLSKRSAADKPFFLFVGYLAPHFPLVIPDEYYERYRGKVELPMIPPGFLDSLPLNYKVLRAAFQEIGVPDDIVRKGRELYYGLTDWVDNEMGKVLRVLRNRDLAENTVVIYTSDHGENMGEHDMWWKSCMYEQSSRVPLIVSYPERWSGGQRRAGASSHLDLVRTVADIGGRHCPDDWNGDSLLPWLDSAGHAWKDFAVSEYYAKSIASGYVMARSGRWKHTFHTTIDKDHGPFRELYDMSADPGEFTNLAARPEHAARIEAMYKRVVREVGGNPEETEQRARAQLAKGYDRTDKPKGRRGSEE